MTSVTWPVTKPDVMDLPAPPGVGVVKARTRRSTPTGEQRSAHGRSRGVEVIDPRQQGKACTRPLVTETDVTTRLPDLEQEDNADLKAHLSCGRGRP